MKTPKADRDGGSDEGADKKKAGRDGGGGSDPNVSGKFSRKWTLQFGQKLHIEYLFAAGFELKERRHSTGADVDNMDPTLALVEILCDRHAAEC